MGRLRFGTQPGGFLPLILLVSCLWHGVMHWHYLLLQMTSCPLWISLLNVDLYMPASGIAIQGSKVFIEAKRGLF